MGDAMILSDKSRLACFAPSWEDYFVVGQVGHEAQVRNCGQ